MKRFKRAVSILILLEVLMFVVGSILMMFAPMHEIGGYVVMAAFVLAVLPTAPMALVWLIDDDRMF